MSQTPRQIFVITDAGRDHDDELAFSVLAGLQRQGRCEVLGAVVNLHPTDVRARLVKGAFASLGLDVPVARGVEGEPHIAHKPYEFAVPYLAAPEEVEDDGQALLLRTCEAAEREGRKITLLLISGMMDADSFVASHPDLARRVLEQVVIMGDVRTDETGTPMLDVGGRLMPGNAYNNSVDRDLNPDPAADPVGPAAKRLYAALQDLAVPTTVLSRHTAYAAAVGPEYYTALRDTGHPMGERLHRDQRFAIEAFWHDIRAGLTAPRLSKEWFASTYCGGGDALARLEADPEHPWVNVTRLNLFDPLAALAAVCPQGLFVPEQGLSKVSGAFDIIGVSAGKPGIADLGKVREALEILPVIGMTAPKAGARFTEPSIRAG